MSDCTIKVPSLIDRAVELGYNGVCITDHEAVSGHIKFLQRHQEGLANGFIPKDFKIGLGNEIYLISEEELTRELQEGERRHYWHFILLAKDKEGHKQLRELSSRAWKRWYREKGAERVPTLWTDLEEVTGKNPGHLIGCTACLGGEFAHHALAYATSGDKALKWPIHEFMTRCIRIFGKNNLFLEMQPRMLSSEVTTKHEQIILNTFIPTLASAYEVDYIVTTDSHYLTKEDRYVHETYLQSDPKNSGERELGDFYETTYLMSEDEIREHLISHLDEATVRTAIENTQKIYDMLEPYDLSHSVIVPTDPKIPQDFEVSHLFAKWYDTCPYIKEFAYSDEIQERYLLYMIERGFIEKKQPFEAVNIERINDELRTMSKISERLGQPIAAYYVMTEGLVHNIMWPVTFVGIARGSATGFYTCYLVGITQISPLDYNLPAYRHLSPERVELPDIDLDISASKRPAVFERMKDYYGKENVLNTLTFKTLTSKSAVLTACRGVGINEDEARTISDLVPIERGMVWSIDDCLNGNEDKERKAIPAFRNAIEKHKDKHLLETIQSLEGIITGRSIHASAMYIFNDGYLAQNSLMRAPNGTPMTAFNMADSDVMGGLKEDVLTIKAQDKLQAAISILIEGGVIEDQGSLKANYDKYLHPDVLEYDAPEMWQMLWDGKVGNAFQMETPVGVKAMRELKPKNLVELAAANSLMRLMTDGSEAPIDTYARYKNDISLWYDEMEKAGLNAEEIKVMEKHLLSAYGVAAVQEEVMELTMDPKIAGFTVAEANKIRKAIAKKKAALLDEMHQFFFTKGRECGTSDAMLNYVWNVQIKRQLGYSFSRLHTTAYSAICLQEMNLAYRYPVIYWNTACLTVNAGADITNENTENTEYGKIARAVNDLRAHGQKIALPDINKAHVGFMADAENDSIVFGLKAINGIGDAQVECILAHRPYESFEGFLKATEDVVKPCHVIALIKSGAFDKLDKRSRTELMRAFLATQAPTLKKLTTAHLHELVESGIIDHSEYPKALLDYVKYVKEHVAIKGKTAATTWVYIEDEDGTADMFWQRFASNMKSDTYKLNDDGYYIAKLSAVQRVRDQALKELRSELEKADCLSKLNEKRIDAYYREKVPGNEATWEMDALLFYYGDHELAPMDKEYYRVSDFSKLPMVPQIQGYSGRYAQYVTTRLAGTVLDRNKNKHTVTLLTEDGIVELKFWKDMFIEYDKQLSDKTNGAKTILEKSWFTRGKKLLVNGYRREDQFVIKADGNIPAVQMITGINLKTGRVFLKAERG